MRPLSKAQKDYILELSTNQGLSAREIGVKAGCSKTAVAKLVSAMLPDKENPVGGRPKKLTPHAERSILTQIRSGRASDMTHTLNAVLDSPITPQTTRNLLRRHHMYAVKQKKKPLLKPHHKWGRLAWAEKHINWTVQDWKRVMFIDESKVNRYQSDGRSYVWKNRGDPLLDREVQKTVKFGGGSIMVWGCMS